MYCDYFGFTEKPFTTTPNPRFIFLSKHHREAFAHLLYGIDNHAGFVELTGEVGTGKTTVIRSLLSQLDDQSHRTALIFNPTLSPVELLRNINREYNIPWEGLNRPELLDTLNRFLLSENREGRTITLVIDEAQNLEPAALEQIRLISNLETETDKLIQIVLAGQPELGRLLGRPELRQLGQRITVRYQLSPMDFEDTRAYIDHRIEIAGGWRAVSFTPGAMKRIYRYSGGIPRLINIACDRALLIAYTEEQREVTDRMAARAISEVRGDGTRRLFTTPRLAAAGFGLVVIATVAGVVVMPRESGTKPPPAPVAAKGAAGFPAPARTVLSPDLFDSLRSEQAAISERDSLVRAFNVLASLWRVPELAGEKELPRGGSLEPAARKRGLLFLKVTSSLDSLLLANSPALLEYSLPGVGGKRFLALTGTSGDRFVVAPPLLGRTLYTRGEIEAFWTGKGYIPWKNYLNLPRLTREGTRDATVADFQKLLGSAKAYDGPPTGIFDAATIAAVKRFQASRGVSPDGMVGSQTLILLYQATGEFAPPLLLTKEEGKS
jgi:general secretion pathway protein A